MTQPRILIATYPFGACGAEPLELLQETGWELVHPPQHRRLKGDEVKELVSDVDAVIAGTEPYTAETLADSQRLRLICRVGIGLDSVDLDYCHHAGITVTYTPDEPSQGVAELTVANILNLLRHIPKSDRSVRFGAWNRFMGRLLSETTIGVLGVGRIGSRVIRLLEPFGPAALAYDIDPLARQQQWPHVTWAKDADELLRESDLVTVHIPLDETTRGYFNWRRIHLMKTGALLVNTARGPIVDEEALASALRQGHLAGAALDVFESEPYDGPLARMDNTVLTAHIGASARATRFQMELGAARDCVRVLSGEAPKTPAPYQPVRRAA